MTNRVSNSFNQTGCPDHDERKAYHSMLHASIYHAVAQKHARRLARTRNIPLLFTENHQTQSTLSSYDESGWISCRSAVLRSHSLISTRGVRRLSSTIFTNFGHNRRSSSLSLLSRYTSPSGESLSLLTRRDGIIVWRPRYGVRAVPLASAIALRVSKPPTIFSVQ